MTRWGRWNWNDIGIGRWHLIRGMGTGQPFDASTLTPAGPPVDIVILACGRVRPTPAETLDVLPPTDQVCPDCREAMGSGEPALSEDAPALVTVGAPATEVGPEIEALPERPAVPDVFRS